MAGMETQVDQDELQGVIEPVMQQAAVPGAAVAVLDGEERTGWGFGVASLETSQPITPDTLFHIGSISKVFTTTLMMNLVDQGLVDLDAAVTRYVPDLHLTDEAALRSLTVRHLLTHTAGFEGDRFLGPEFGTDSDALARCISRYNTLQQVSAPGELWSYCNTGFYLASYLAATVLDMPFEDAMRRRIFQPLGMERSTMYVHEAITYPIAVGHQPGPEGPTPERIYMISRQIAGAGRVISSVNDLLKFAAFHLGDGTADGRRVMSESSLHAMQEPQAWLSEDHAWGLGWSIRFAGEKKIVEHSGGGYGMIANLALVPGNGFAVAVLTNSNAGSAVTGAVTDWALHSYRGLERAPLTLDPLPEDQLQRYTGTFQAALRHLSFSIRDGDLVVEIIPADEGKIFGAKPLTVTLGHVGNGNFVTTHNGAISSPVVAEFIEGPDGEIQFVRFGGRLATPVQQS